MSRLLVAVALCAWCSCTGEASVASFEDGGPAAADATSAPDATPQGADAGELDAATMPDAAGAPDASALDAAEVADAAGAPDAAEPPDASEPDGGGPDGGCPADMVAIPGFCIDRYEAPNLAGQLPLAMQNATDGAAWCAARGKRLCTEAEWVRACQGPAGLPYPYGTTYVRSRCDDDKTWISPDWTALGTWPSAAAQAEATRLYQADPSGLRTGCVSAEGVYDLCGNVAEWVDRSFDHPPNNYAQVMKGCYWSGCYGGTGPNCSFTNPAHPGGFRTYEGGFRCCRAP